MCVGCVCVIAVQSLSRVRLFVTPWTAARQASHHQLRELAHTHVRHVGDALQPSPPLSPSSLALTGVCVREWFACVWGAVQAA